MNQRRVPDRGMPENLDPRLAKFRSKLSPTIQSRLNALEKAASTSEIHPDRIVKYGVLLAVAEQQAHGDEISAEQARRARAERAGELHGFEDGFMDPEEAIRRYRLTRMARQCIRSSIEGVLGRWNRTEPVLRKYRLDLPVHARSKFSDNCLAAVRKQLNEMAATTLFDEEDFTHAQGSHEPNRTAQTYLWWHYFLPRYRGKWKDMHQLALVWRLTAIRDEQVFKAVVRRSCKGNKPIRFPLGNVWESIVSANP